MKTLSHPAFLTCLILAFVILASAVARWRYVRKQRSASDALPTIPASEMAHPPGTIPTAGPVMGPAHALQESLERALRRGDKALGFIEGSSLPFLDTAPLTHHQPKQG